MSISEMTGIPRPTVLRKLNKCQNIYYFIPKCLYANLVIFLP